MLLLNANTELARSQTKAVKRHWHNVVKFYLKFQPITSIQWRLDLGVDRVGFMTAIKCLSKSHIKKSQEILFNFCNWWISKSNITPKFPRMADLPFVDFCINSNWSKTHFPTNRKWVRDLQYVHNDSQRPHVARFVVFLRAKYFRCYKTIAYFYCWTIAKITVEMKGAIVRLLGN